MDGNASTELPPGAGNDLPQVLPPALPNALHGYDRRAVEDFFERAATRRARLVEVIAAATARREQAVDAQTRNRAIAHDARRELEEIHAAAESQATQIILEARLQAQLVLRAARDGVGAENVVDIRDSDRSANGSGPARNGTTANGTPNGGASNGGTLSFANLAPTSLAVGNYESSTTDYFEYLRGALPIDTPGAEFA